MIGAHPRRPRGAPESARASLAHLDGPRVRVQAFRVARIPATTGARRATPARDTSCTLMHFTKSVTERPPRVRADAACGQDVIGAAGVIAERLRAPIAEKNAAGGIDRVEQAVLRRRAGSNAPARTDSRIPQRPRDLARPARRHFSRASGARDSSSAILRVAGRFRGTAASQRGEMW